MEKDTCILPSVSFDINLGKTVKYIDFDYDAYGTHLQNKGISNQQIATLSVEVEQGHFYDTKPESYSPAKNRIRLKLTKNQAKTNRNLIHGTEHSVDNVLENYTDTERRLTVASNIMLLASYGLYPLSVMTVVAQEVIEAVPVSSSHAGKFMLGSLLLMFGGHGFHRINPVERRAFRAAKSADSKPFISYQYK